MVVIDNILLLQSLYSAWLSSLNNQIIVLRWLMIYLDLHFLVHNYHSLVAKYRHLCSWSHTVHGHILFGHNCWTRCHEDIWNIVTSLNDITDATVRSDVHRSWSTSWTKIIGQDCWPSSSSPSTADATTPVSLTFIFVSDHNFNIYIHPSITTSTTVLL